MKYPFHRIGALLSREEAESSSIVRDVLTTETDGGKMQLVQTGTESQEELSEEVPLVRTCVTCICLVELLKSQAIFRLINKHKV